MKKLILCVLSVASIAAFAAPEVWVAEDGHDDTGDGTEGNPYATIATGVANCDANGTVHVAAGNYTVTSTVNVENGVKVVGELREKTTVSRFDTATAKAYRVFKINHADSVVSGLTIRNGYITGQGGGVYIDENGGLLSDCIVCENQVNSNPGAGVGMANSSSAIVSNCVIRKNVSVGYNGVCPGVYMNGAGLIVDSEIRDNMINNAGGAAWVLGGVRVNGGTVLRCKVIGNMPTQGGALGGGIAVEGPGGTIEDCLIARNEVDQGSGGGIGIRATTVGGKVLIKGCTIIENRAPNGGGGIFVHSANKATVEVEDSIIQGNWTFDDATDYAPEYGGSITSFKNCVSPVGFPEDLSEGCDKAVVRFADPENEDWTPLYAPWVVGRGCPRWTAGDFDLNFEMSAEQIAAGADLVLKAEAWSSAPGDAFTYRWKFGDEAWTEWSSDPEILSSWSTVGAYEIVLQAAVNGAAQPKTVTRTVEVAPTRTYVVNSNVVKDHVASYPYDSWETAAFSIQEAVDAVLAGGTVLVSNGVYSVSDTVVIDRGIVLKSVNGRDVTQIKNIKPTTVVHNIYALCRPLAINHPDAVVDGFHISHGAYNITGNSNPSLPDSKGIGCQIGPRGGTLLNSSVTDSNPSRLNQGALAILSDLGVVSNCVVSGNAMSGWGASAAAYVTKGLLTHSSVINNKLTPNNSSCGCGAYLDGTGCIAYCVISNNVISSAGSVGGGGVMMKGGVLSNCLIVKNTGGNGGGVYQSGGLSINCTIADNIANIGGGVYASTAAAQVYNALMSGNTSGSSDSSAGKPEWYGDTADWQYCVAPVPFPKTAVECVNGDAGFEPGGYDIGLSSDAWNAGGQESLYEDIESAVDYAGRPRKSGKRIDTGCYEYQEAGFSVQLVAHPALHAKVDVPVTFTAAVIPEEGAYEYEWTIDSVVVQKTSSASISRVFGDIGDHAVSVAVYSGGTLLGSSAVLPYVSVPARMYVVDPSTPGHVPASPYASWDTAATDIGTALALAGDGVTVIVSNGLYKITNRLVLNGGTVLKSENGREVTEIRNVLASSEETVIAGLVAMNHAEARVEGFTLSNGKAYNIGTFEEKNYGVGALIGDNGGKLISCAITGCTQKGSNYGAAFAVLGDAGVVSNCWIHENYEVGDYNATNPGGYLKKGLVTHTLFDGNTLTANAGYPCHHFGAALYAVGGRVTHCVFTNNTITGVGNATVTCYGAGVYANGDVIIDNCLFVDNAVTPKSGETQFTGGGVRIAAGTLLNCTMIGNSAYRGGGVAADATAILRNCLMQDNVATEGPDLSGDGADVTYSLAPTGLPEGDGNVVARAIFKPRRRSLVPYRLDRNSPGCEAGSEVGFEQYLVGATDLEGNPRIFGQSIDMGCIESDHVRGLMLMVR